MILDRYDPVNLFALVPHLGLALDPELAQLDRVLDDDVLFERVKQDLRRRYPQSSRRGRHATPIEVILRLLVVKHLDGWSYEQTEHFVNDSLVVRQFCRLSLTKAPADTTLLRWANLIQPETLHHRLDRVVELARTQKVTRGRKLRSDGTVVETNTHSPTDSTVLGDGVRVLSRTLTKARQVLAATGDLGGEVFRNRLRSAKRQVKRIQEATRQRGQPAEQALQTAYQQLLGITQAVLDQARHVGTALPHQTNRTAQRLAATLDTFIPQVEQVIRQTTRRVLHGEHVPADEKVVSLHPAGTRPHTAIIRKGKLAQPTEFGRMVWLDEVEGGIISRYAVLDGNPREEAEVRPSLDQHLALFDHPPKLVAGDRGTYAPAGERYAQDHGVNQVVLPQPGKKSAARSAHEHQRWFRRGRRWRAGIEGRISGLKRRHGLERCLYHGPDGMERWVGWGVMAHDLRVIARAIAA